MLIDTSEFRKMPGLVSAVLNESVDDAGTLALEWVGFAPEWVGWEEPVTLRHRGRILFHGKITSFTNGNAANATNSTATVTNALWLMDHMTVGAQIAEWQAAQQGSNGGDPSVGAPVNKKKANIQNAGQAAISSWADLAESCRIDAPGWVVDEAGNPREDAQLQLDISAAVYSVGANYGHRGAITAWTAMLDMRSANPDAVFVPDYTTGAIRVISIGAAEQITWDTEEVRLTDIAAISPQYENCITGVLLLIGWEGETGSGSVTMKYPEEISENADRVKLFTITTDSAQHAQEQLSFIGEQLKAYYRAVNTLQWGGTITALLEDVPTSPLGKRLNLVGDGAHESWGTMAAIVSGVTWDFVEGTVQVSLGSTFSEPDLVELEFADSTTTTTTSEKSTGDWGGPEPSTDDDWRWTWLPKTTQDTTTDAPGPEPGSEPGPGDLLVTLGPPQVYTESFGSTIKLTVEAQVEKDGEPYTNVSYQWSANPEWGNVARQDGTLEATWFGLTEGNISYKLVVTDLDTGAQAEAEGVYNPEWILPTTTSNKPTTTSNKGTQGTQAPQPPTTTAQGSGSGSGQGSGSGSGQGSDQDQGSGCDCNQELDTLKKDIEDLQKRVGELEKNTTGTGCDCSKDIQDIKNRLEALESGTSGSSCNCAAELQSIRERLTKLEASGGNTGTGGISELQKVYNLFLYAYGYGFDFGSGTLPHDAPALFPDWLNGSMPHTEVMSRMNADFARLGGGPL